MGFPPYASLVASKKLGRSWARFSFPVLSFSGVHFIMAGLLLQDWMHLNRFGRAETTVHSLTQTHMCWSHQSLVFVEQGEEWNLASIRALSIDACLPVGEDWQEAQMVPLLETIPECYFLSIKQAKADLVTYQPCITLAAQQIPVEKQTQILRSRMPGWVMQKCFQEMHWNGMFSPVGHS